MAALLETKPEASTPAMHDRTLVLGLGNTLQGDDGVGFRAAELLAQRDLPAGVKVEAIGMPGIGLVTKMKGWQQVYIIDAAEVNQEPGTWKRFEPEDVKLISNGDMLSLHDMDVAGALALAEALDILPEELVIYGVEPEEINWGNQLSASVQAALTDLVDQILRDLWKGQG